jgi:hypothetical protein
MASFSPCLIDHRTEVTIAALLRERCDMKTEQRNELLAAAVARLEEAAQLLKTAEEEVLADQANELADLVDVIATPMAEIA